MAAEVERLSWRESIAAQLYEIADRWSRGDVSECQLAEELYVVGLRCYARHGGNRLEIPVRAYTPAEKREKEWR